jgi:glycosyltransferase involved in cell wall biosynthesis
MNNDIKGTGSGNGYRDSHEQIQNTGSYRNQNGMGAGENSVEQLECVSIVMPAYNEEGTLETVVQRVLKVPHLLEVVIVNDCSSDATGKVAEKLARQHPKVKVLHQPVNCGKTEALKTGFASTRGDIVIVQDADLEYDPSDIGEVIAPILGGEADVVYGSRFLVRRTARVLYFYHYLANKGLTFLSNLFTNVNLTDVETGYKAFRGDIIREMRITSSGFGFEIEVTAKVAKLGCRLYEVPISYYGRTYEEGKKIGTMDGVAALWYIVKFNLLCSLEKSYRLLPAVGPTRFPNVVSEVQLGPNGKGVTASE